MEKQIYKEERKNKQQNGKTSSSNQVPIPQIEFTLRVCTPQAGSSTIAKGRTLRPQEKTQPGKICS
jgi:hypothetical protein